MILLDNCVPRKYRALLESWGYPVRFLHDYGSADAADDQVIALAQELDAILLTVDMDFANILRYPPQDYAGLVVVRYQPLDETELNGALRQALADLYRDGLRQVLVVVASSAYRIRRGT